MISHKDKASIYIHWPFCKSKCPYCDFNSHVADSVDHQLWLKMLITELSYYTEYLVNKQVISIFFGGGTPSLAHQSVISGLLEYIAKHFTLVQDIEITMEANPTSIEVTKFASIAQSGVNRVSLGVQSLIPENLVFLGREHSVNEALCGIELARQYFSRYSFDLIYALPHQTLSSWEQELTEAIKLANGHISLYQLTIEKGTPFFKDYHLGKFVLPNTELAADLYMLTESLLKSRGYHAYEVSNYAHHGQESVHNLQYWRYGEYVGIGPGAHGRIRKDNQRYATQNISSPQGWLEAVQQNGHGLQRYEPLTLEEMRTERLLMGLRTIEGIETQYIPFPDKLQVLIDHNLLNIINGKIIPTIEGRLLLNSIVAYLA